MHLASPAVACLSMFAAQRECWLGGLPVIFVLAPAEIATLAKPRPYAMVLSRQSLLPLATEAVRCHFVPFGQPMGGELWLGSSSRAPSMILAPPI